MFLAKAAEEGPNKFSPAASEAGAVVRTTPNNRYFFSDYMKTIYDSTKVKDAYTPPADAEAKYKAALKNWIDRTEPSAAARQQGASNQAFADLKKVGMAAKVLARMGTNRTKGM